MNARDQTDPEKNYKKASRETYSFLEVKLRQSDWKSWTKIKIFMIKTQHTVFANSSSLNSRVRRHNIECKAICSHGIYMHKSLFLARLRGRLDERPWERGWHLKRTSSFFDLTDKEASTALCSAVKHAGSGRARNKCREKHKTQSSVFPYFLSALRALQHNRTQSRLLHLFYDKESNNFPTHSLKFQTTLSPC